MSSFENLVSICQHHAQSQPDQVAYRFISETLQIKAELTYEALDQKARSLAARLLQQIKPGDSALLIYSPGIDFIVALFGCLYAGVIAVPVYPPQAHIKRLNMSLLRLQSTLVDSQPQVLLTTQKLNQFFYSDRIRAAFSETIELFSVQSFYDVPVILTDQVDFSEHNTSMLPSIDTHTIALLQYTSGSTGDPKGVVLSHSNIINNVTNILQLEQQHYLKESLSWLPLYHDMGIISGVFIPFYGGFRSTLMSTLDFLRNPVSWLQALSQCRDVMSGGPNFAYELCCQRITDEQLKRLDLSQWRVAFSGAETNRVSTYERFQRRFSECGFNNNAFYSCYGLAEATVYVSGGVVAQAPIITQFDEKKLQVQQATPKRAGRWLLSVGACFSDHDMLIVDPESTEVKLPGEVGEIWISGPSVAKGYWNNPELTEKIFHAFTENNRGPYLRTGDLGFVVDGQLYVYGRCKDLIIVRGRSFPPQDLEWAISMSEPRIRKGNVAAFSIEKDNQEQVIIVAEIRPSDNETVNTMLVNIRECIGRDFGLKVHDIVLVKAKTLPKTTSDKIKRYACREAYLHCRLERYLA